MSFEAHFPFPLSYVDTTILERLDQAFLHIEAKYKAMEKSSKARMGETLRRFGAKYTQALERHAFASHEDLAPSTDSDSSEDERNETAVDCPNNRTHHCHGSGSASCRLHSSTGLGVGSVTTLDPFVAKADAAVKIMEDWLAELEAQSLHRFYATVQYIESKYAQGHALDYFRQRIDHVVTQVEKRFLAAVDTTTTLGAAHAFPSAMLSLSQATNDRLEADSERPCATSLGTTTNTNRPSPSPLRTSCASTTATDTEQRIAPFAGAHGTAMPQTERKLTTAAILKDATLLATRAAFLGARRLLDFEELPLEWRENQYIRSGYRFLHSKTQCLSSIFQYHNETGNIWTHLLGLIFFVAFGCYEIYHRFGSISPWSALTTEPLTTWVPWFGSWLTTGATSSSPFSTPTAAASSVSWVDGLVFLLFFASACKCLLCSTMYHTFCHHSHLGTMRCAVMLDYIGISVLITASIMTVVYYSYYCTPFYQSLYLALSLLVGAVGISLSTFSWFDHTDYRHVRVTIFVLMSVLGILPLTQLAYTYGTHPVLEFITPIVKSLACYVAGVYFYANKYPERLYPGHFDLIGNSHQLWHLGVIGGIYYHYTAVIHFYESRFTFGCAV
ncbi:inc metabolism membrane protein [Dimargaris verticillata]|uniref:Inc metabolism membrane protein n=1 Tax=Dimargaris verticillata TaxID=2761393 RepID=A0A9W8B206_9FUNG|nr:inc metabolism membrane protein [Dimargaris verticillata]